MAELQVAHTAALSHAQLHEIRVLLNDAFAGQFDDADYEHGLGGMHALLRSDGALIAHGSVVMRRLLHADRALRTGYVEAVAVRPDRRGRGHGAAVMTALESVIRGGYELGALASSAMGMAFYPALGWQRWRGRTSVISRSGIRRTPDEDGTIWVLPVSAPLDLDGDVACDWRDGDVW
jgi:aminoglycoside 2'-N-acetyltransferase I